MKTISRFNFFWQAFFSACSILATALIISDIASGGSFSLKQCLVLISCITMLVAFLFVAPAAKVTFDSDGFVIHMGFGLPWFEFLQIKNKGLDWTNVIEVFSATPSWSPIKLILVLSFDGNKNHAFGLGTFLTNTSHALEILSNHVSKERIDESVQKIIERNAKKKRVRYRDGTFSG